MGGECGMWEMGEGKSNDFELSLELSIGGGKYEKPENSGGGMIREISEGPRNDDFERSVFSCDGPVQAQTRKEIQALRRQEARKKRGEKLKKSRKVRFLDNSNNNKNKKICEARGKDVILGEKIRKRGKNGGGGGEAGKDELSLTLCTENKNVVVGVPSQQREIGECLLYPEVQHLAAAAAAAPLNYGLIAYPNHPCGEAPFWGGETVSNRSLEQSSPVVSDYQSTSHKGGSCSDTGSLPGKEFDQLFESNDSSCQTEPDHRLRVDPTKLAPSSSTNPQSSWGPFPEGSKLEPDVRLYNQPNNNGSRPAMPRPMSEQTSGGLNEDKLVEPVARGPNNAASPVVPMPCVSTTGNGPNGRTVRGFLYKYTKREVSIVCVCHGSSFSPAGFVEHAGGVDISHPLRHITIVGPAFG